MNFLKSKIIFALCVLFTLAHAADIEVKTAGEFAAAVAKLSPGDNVILANGTYDLGRVVITNQATAERPISIRAKNRDRATVTGQSCFVFEQAAHITLAGLNFETDDVGPVQILGSHHIRISRCVLRVHESPREPGGLLRWILIDGAKAPGSTNKTVNSHHNRIDHNLLEGKRVRGQGVAIDGVNHPVYASSQYDRIDHNHFRNFGPRIPNGMEPIRAGLAELSVSSGYTLIEDNLFENCDGDSEVISMKNSDSIARSNTVVNCQSGIYLRHGDRNQVYGNVFFGQNKPGSVGVRMWGNDHSIHDNYFQDLDEAGIEVQNGDVDYPAPVDPARDKSVLVLHVRPQRIAIQTNTLVNCAHPFLLGGTEPNWDFKLPARGVRIEGNMVLGGRNPLVTVFHEVPSVLWQGNTMWSGPQTKLGIDATEAQIRITEPSIVTPRWLTGGDVGPLAGKD